MREEATSEPAELPVSTPQHHDRELVAACLGGDERAWRELVDRYARLVFAVGRRAGLSESDAEDALQTVFLALHRNLAGLRSHDSLSSWLITTTRREALRLRRKSVKVRSRQHAVAGSASDLDREPDVVRDSADPERDDALADAEQRNLVRLGLRRLGGRCEQLLTALFLATGDPSYEAISESLGMPIGSIGPTRARCFRKLEAILLDLGVEVPESTLVGSAGITTPVPRLLHP